VLDGEICCLEPDGRTHFKNLLFRREWPFFYAFDVLNIEGEDLTNQPLLERKRRLRRLMPTIDSRLLSLEHIEQRGCDLFRAACERDLEGIVAKWAHGTYGTDGRTTSWLKIKNPQYSQMRDRHELFERRPFESRRPRDPRHAPISCFGDGALASWPVRATIPPLCPPPCSASTGMGSPHCSATCFASARPATTSD
jgi:ATP dependent DNA ligase domain